jgi:hypothetical protein
MIMSRATTAGGWVLCLAAVCLTGAVGGVARGADEKDPLRADTVWKGEIHQGTEVLTTTIYIKERDKDRIRGEIHFKSPRGNLAKLTFQGNVVDGRTVAWITDKKEGNVTYPGLYIGTIKEKTLSGVWQVPSDGQYDTFSVELAE